jgi:hypothetical protein
VTCAASAEILLPTASIDEYGMSGDPFGPYRLVTLRGQATDAMGMVIDPLTLVFEWSTDRADLYPGGATSGSQLIITGSNPGPFRLYGIASSPAETQTITLTVRATAGGPVLSTDSFIITIHSLI